MTHYFVFGCEEIPLEEDDPRNVYTVKEALCQSAEQAVRASLTDEQILNWDWTVVEVRDAIHADEFRHDGVFDDIEPQEG
jgi:hypothetical protein